MKKIIFLLFSLALVAHLSAADEDPQAAINAKLREGLRNTMLQLQTAQGQVATLQATQTEDEAKIKDLTAQLATLTKQSADAKTASDKTIADLKAQVAAQDTRNALQVEALGKWKEGYNKLVDQARAIDARRAALAAAKIQADRKIDDQQRRNQALYTLGKEILHRYEHYGLGDALAAREPFTGIAKVKFETYIQDNSDKLDDQKIKP
jgi:chromosome segregation ATPase